MALIKADIIDSLKSHSGYSRSRSTILLETILDILKVALASCESVLVSGFGKRHTKDKTERSGRNLSVGNTGL